MEEGRLIITRRDEKILSLMLRDNRLIKAGVWEESFPVVGDIFIGKVKNIAVNIGAAFVEIEKGINCFLALNRIENPMLINRTYNGKLQIGDEIVVQVEKEALKTKEAVITTNLSFSGKYTVLTTGRKDIGYSHKLKEAVKKQIGNYLKEWNLLELQADGVNMGLVIRTNAGSLSAPEDYGRIRDEIQLLLKEAKELLGICSYRTCYTKLKSAPAPYLADIRDAYTESYSRIITDDREIYENLEESLQGSRPEDLEKLYFYQDKTVSLSSLYGIEGKLKEALSPKVWLKSGGYLVIEPTEALTVIDVNTGKYVGKKKIEETFYTINREACEEIAVQLRLRNISGIIIIDFINMESEKHRKEIFCYLRTLLKKDSVKTEVIDMTSLGLVEVTRKKVHKTLAEQMGSQRR